MWEGDRGVGWGALRVWNKCLQFPSEKFADGSASVPLRPHPFPLETATSGVEWHSGIDYNSVVYVYYRYIYTLHIYMYIHTVASAKPKYSYMEPTSYICLFLAVYVICHGCDENGKYCA